MAISWDGIDWRMNTLCFVCVKFEIPRDIQMEMLNKQLYIYVWNWGERSLCWRYKFGNFQHLDHIKAMGLDKTTKGVSLDREEKSLSSKEDLGYYNL